MSRDEAHRRPAASGEPATTALPAAGRTNDGPRLPRPPLFTARTDRITGAITARGHLDRLGAEALCRTVTALQQLGHREIAVRLGSATLTDEARALLSEHARRLASDGVRLLLA